LKTEYELSITLCQQGHTAKDQALRAEDVELANFFEYQEKIQLAESLSTDV